jgi:[protein-PII] uridylyltransferase
VRATDRTGLLALLTGVFERAGVDIAWAKVVTLGLSAIDTFCIVLPDHAEGSPALTREAPERDLLAVLPTTVPETYAS